MLKYEKLLHFDQHYKKLRDSVHQGKCQGTCQGTCILSLVYGAMVYTMVFFLFRYAMIYVPDQKAWNSDEILVLINRVEFEAVDIFYYAAGLLTVCYGAVRLTKITYMNHSVRTDDKPTTLLTDGYYAKVRHPMYGTFVILYAGVLLSMRSRNGMILALLFLAGQYINAWMEEKKLRNLFHGEYMVYCKKTKSRILTKLQILCFMAGIAVTVLGFVIHD